jgi:glycosyltransferase involved in cell wall biosynthesis
MTGISAVIITLNEERNIGRCLNSIREIADEIIVVDSFSTDKTGEIVQQKGAHFIQHEWQGYSATKNFANQQATHSFILSLDADEALSAELQQSILAAKKQGLSGIYSFNRLTNYCGKWVKHCGWYPDKKARLFPKEAANWEGDFVHEEIAFKGNNTETFLKGDLHHYSYYTTQEHYDRVEKYAQLGAEKLLDKQKSGSKLKGIFSAISRFISMYCFKLGFLDGTTGYRVCKISAYAAYLKYKKLHEIKAKTA